MARHFKRCRLLVEEQALPSSPAVTDDSDLPPYHAFVRLPTTPGSPLVIHNRTEVGGMPVAVKVEELQGFGPVLSIYGFVMQQ
jgi:hypothetical protein